MRSFFDFVVSVLLPHMASTCALLESAASSHTLDLPVNVLMLIDAVAKRSSLSRADATTLGSHVLLASLRSVPARAMPSTLSSHAAHPATTAVRKTTSSVHVGALIAARIVNIAAGGASVINEAGASHLHTLVGGNRKRAHNGDDDDDDDDDKPTSPTQSDVEITS
jgi:hypothetical protein